MSRHSFVAPILTAPLLIDTRRSTVGPGTREDLACVVGGVRHTSALRNIGNMFLLYSGEDGLLRAPSSWMGSCHETFQCYQRRCKMVLAGIKKVPFVVSICATAPFVRCDTGAHARDSSQYIMWRFAGNDDKKNIAFKYVELSVDKVNLEHWL